MACPICARNTKIRTLVTKKFNKTTVQEYINKLREQRHLTEKRTNPNAK